MTSNPEFDTAEEVEAATALYGQLLCGLIRRLADRELLDASDLAALAETIEQFRSEDEHLPEVVGRHANVLAEFLRKLPQAGTSRQR